MHGLYTDTSTESYRLSMQTISDELEVRHIDHILHNPGDPIRLEGVRLFRDGMKPAPNYVYLIPPHVHPRDLRWFENSSFIVFGPATPEEYSFTACYIAIREDKDSIGVFNAVQDIFDKYAKWDRELKAALQSEDPLERMLAVSLPIFQNPMFLHDRDFYVLACPRWLTGMLQWEKEPRTGREMVPLELINTFRVDEEYLATLKTTGASVFSAAIRGYRILYANLWHHEHYSGRICIDELERALRKSDFQHLDHLSRLVSACMNRQKLLWMSIGSEIDTLFTNVLSGKDVDKHTVNDYLRYLNWNPEDQYAVLKIVSDREDYRAITPAALFGYIEAQIAECHALLYQQEIVVIVNLTASTTTISGVLSSLAYILRDGMFKIGVSSEIGSFLMVHHGYTQASVALNYGKRGHSMMWYYHFRDHALEFLLDSACSILPPHLLVSEKLQKLKRYDAENNTELFRTTEMYLKQERNAVLTAKELFIHRSTLFYRLNRIQQISGIDFDDERERLYLLLSFQLPQTEG